MGKVGRPKGSYTQHRRLKDLRELLENHPKGLKASELAERLGVTDRSMRRYLRELEREVDVDRASDPDGSGGVVVKIPARDLPRRVNLHRTQIYGLLMARRVFRMLEGTAFHDTLGQAVDKLLSHVQRPPRRGALVDPDTRLEDRFLYLPAAPMRRLDDTSAEVVDVVLDACAQLRVCRIQYRKHAGDGAAEPLTVEPYAVVLYKDAIYCVAFVHERKAMRTLRVDRIVDAEQTLDHFDLPEGFRVDAHFAGQFGVHTGGDPERVVVDFHPRVADLVRSRSFPGEDGGEARCAELPGGGVRLVMRVPLTPELKSWVLSFGETARVIEPAALASQVVDELRHALAAYDGAPVAAPPTPRALATASARGRKRA
jgi:predicted DNA-binding transcriptional regulator YafY